MEENPRLLLDLCVSRVKIIRESSLVRLGGSKDPQNLSSKAPTPRVPLRLTSK